MKNRIKTYFIALTAVVIVLLSLVGQSTVRNKFYLNENDVTLVKDYWFYYIGDKHIDTLSLPYKIPYHIGKSMPMEEAFENNIITEKDKDYYICFRTVQQQVKVYIDDQLIYEYGKEKGSIFKVGPGSRWNLVHLPKEKLVQNIRIELKSAGPMYAGVMSDVMLGERSAIILKLINQYITGYVYGIIVSMAGFILFLILISIRKLRVNKLIYLSISVIITGMWMVMESRVIQFFRGDSYELTLMNTFIPMILLSVVLCYATTLDDFQGSRFVEILWIGSILNMVVVILLQIAGLVDIYLFYPVTIILYALVFFYTTYRVFKRVVKAKSIKAMTIKDWGFCTMGLFFAYDRTLFYLYRKVDSGDIFRLGITIYIITIFIWYTKKLVRVSTDEIMTRTYQKLAYMDVLTGLENRAAFEAYMDKIRGKNVKNASTLSVMIIDINNLKEINDTLGHKKGDQAIYNVGNCIRRAFTDCGNAYRIGGDEFCIISQHQKEQLLEQAIINVQRYLKKCDLAPGWSLSIAHGYAFYSEGSNQSIDDIFTKADRNMYECKTAMKMRESTKFKG